MTDMAAVFNVDAGLRDQVAGWLKKAFLDDIDGAPEKDETFSIDDIERGDALPPWVALASSEAHCRELESTIKRLEQEPALFLRATEDLPKHEITTDTCRAAGAALEAHPSLRQLRFELVPRIIGEDEFWQRYFAAVDHIHDKLLAGGPPTCGAMSCSTSSAGSFTTGTEDAAWSFLDEALLASCFDNLPPTSLPKRRHQERPGSTSPDVTLSPCPSAASSDAAMHTQPSSATHSMATSPHSLEVDLLSLGGLPDINGMLFGDIGLHSLWPALGASGSSDSSDSARSSAASSQMAMSDTEPRSPARQAGALLGHEYISSLALADVQVMGSSEPAGMQQTQPQHPSQPQAQAPTLQADPEPQQQQQAGASDTHEAVGSGSPHSSGRQQWGLSLGSSPQLSALFSPAFQQLGQLWEQQWEQSSEEEWAVEQRAQQEQQQQQQSQQQQEEQHEEEQAMQAEEPEQESSPQLQQEQGQQQEQPADDGMPEHAQAECEQQAHSPEPLPEPAKDPAAELAPAPAAPAADTVADATAITKDGTSSQTLPSAAAEPPAPAPEPLPVQSQAPPGLATLAQLLGSSGLHQAQDDPSQWLSDDMAELPLHTPDLHNQPPHMPVKAAAVRKLADALVAAQQLQLRSLSDLSSLHVSPAVARLQSGPTRPAPGISASRSPGSAGLGLGRMLSAVRGRAAKAGKAPEPQGKVMTQIWSLFERLEGGRGAGAGGRAADGAAGSPRSGGRLQGVGSSGDFLVDVAREMAGLATLADMGSAWQEVVQELQLRWASGERVPGLPCAAVSQPHDPPLHLHLLVLNLCIAHKSDRQAAAGRAAGGKQAAGSAVRDSSGMVLQRQGALHVVPGLQMALTGEPVWQPERQDFSLQARSLLARLPGSRVAGLLDMGHTQLTSDISAFKAANPSCVMQDYMAWSGAARAASSLPAGPCSGPAAATHLPGTSAGAGVDLATWREVFERAPPLPARLQQPLLDEALLAEEVLEALAALPAAELLGQLALLLARVLLAGASGQRTRSSQVAASVGHASAALEQLQLVAAGQGCGQLDADSVDMLLATLDAVEDMLVRLHRRSGSGDCFSDGSSSGARGAADCEEEAWVLV